MKKPEVTAEELEKLYIRLDRITRDIQAVMKFIDEKYVDISAHEYSEREKNKKEG